MEFFSTNLFFICSMFFMGLNAMDKDLSCCKVLTGHTDSIISVAVAGNIAITGSSDNTAKVWNLTTGECIYTLEGHKDGLLSVAVAGNYVITGSYD